MSVLTVEDENSISYNGKPLMERIDGDTWHWQFKDDAPNDVKKSIEQIALEHPVDEWNAIRLLSFIHQEHLDSCSVDMVSLFNAYVDYADVIKYSIPFTDQEGIVTRIDSNQTGETTEYTLLMDSNSQIPFITISDYELHQSICIKHAWTIPKVDDSILNVEFCESVPLFS